jgi:hypothetical protein
MNEDPLLVEAQEAIEAVKDSLTTETTTQRPIDMAAVVELSNTLVQLENEVAAAEESLSALKDRRRKVAEDHLPAMLADLGIDALRLSNGKQIVINEFVDARIKDQDIAFAWLRETNNSSIIKNEVKANLDRGNDALVSEILKTLQEMGVNASCSSTVHHATLKSFCRDALDNPELAESLPREAFGIFQGKRAKVT